MEHNVDLDDNIAKFWLEPVRLQADGRTVSVPLEWYPRLAHGTPAERQKWRLVGGGVGIHWPELDEDISVENLLLGQASAESQRSLKAWLEGRQATSW